MLFPTYFSLDSLSLTYFCFTTSVLHQTPQLFQLSDFGFSILLSAIFVLQFFQFSNFGLHYWSPLFENPRFLEPFLSKKKLLETKVEKINDYERSKVQLNICLGVALERKKSNLTSRSYQNVCLDVGLSLGWEETLVFHCLHDEIMFLLVLTIIDYILYLWFLKSLMFISTNHSLSKNV